LRDLRQSVQAVQTLADNAETVGPQFLDAVNKMGKTIVSGSRNELIAELLHDLDQHTVWASLWVRPPHFQAAHGRKQKARYIANIGDAVRCGDAAGAETSMRCMADFSRDQIIDALARGQNEEAAPWRLQ